MANFEVSPHATSMPMLLPTMVLVDQSIISWPSCCVHIAASMSVVWKTLPTFPKYLRLYSRSKEGDAFAFSISPLV